MSDGIDYLLEEGIIHAVLGRLQSGKEAEVFIVSYGSDERVVVAKAYKDRGQRSFKNNAGYKEGRTVRSSRDQRAMSRGSSFGRAAAEDAWKSAEVEALYTLHRAGVRVPTPVMYIEGVLLMELVLGEDDGVAPRIIDTDLDAAQANAAYHDMLSQLVKILSCDLIHGDLSPYNVLWGASGPTIIDFPQIISAAHNSRAEWFFLRDAHNILSHFVAIDPTLRARSGDAEEIWRTYARRELTPDFVPQGRARPLPSRHQPRRDAPVARPQPPRGVPAPAPPTQGRVQPRPAPQRREPPPRPEPAPRPAPPARVAPTGAAQRREPPRQERSPRPVQLRPEPAPRSVPSPRGDGSPTARGPAPPVAVAAPPVVLPPATPSPVAAPIATPVAKPATAAPPFRLPFRPPLRRPAIAARSRRRSTRAFRVTRSSR